MVVEYTVLVLTLVPCKKGRLTHWCVSTVTREWKRGQGVVPKGFTLGKSEGNCRGCTCVGMFVCV